MNGRYRYILLCTLTCEYLMLISVSANTNTSTVLNQIHYKSSDIIIHALFLPFTLSSFVIYVFSTFCEFTDVKFSYHYSSHTDA